MADKVIAIEERSGPFRLIFQRVMRMVPDRDKGDKNIQRLLAFRLQQDGEAATNEYLIRKIRDMIQCGYTGSLYDYLKDNVHENMCKSPDNDPISPEVA